MADDDCARCGEVIADDSQAMIGEDRYCHGDVRPTCYELASWAGFSWMSHIADMSDYWPDLKSVRPPAEGAEGRT